MANFIDKVEYNIALVVVYNVKPFYHQTAIMETTRRTKTMPIRRVQAIPRWYHRRQFKPKFK
jgi:hypothetical protein